jgi:hypothetical protein
MLRHGAVHLRPIRPPSRAPSSGSSIRSPTPSMFDMKSLTTTQRNVPARFRGWANSFSMEGFKAKMGSLQIWITITTRASCCDLHEGKKIRRRGPYGSFRPDRPGRQSKEDPRRQIRLKKSGPQCDYCPPKGKFLLSSGDPKLLPDDFSLVSLSQRSVAARASRSHHPLKIPPKDKMALYC